MLDQSQICIYSSIKSVTYPTSRVLILSSCPAGFKIARVRHHEAPYTFWSRADRYSIVIFVLDVPILGGGTGGGGLTSFTLSQVFQVFDGAVEPG
jgi:hypothetical protein